MAKRQAPPVDDSMAANPETPIEDAPFPGDLPPNEGEEGGDPSDALGAMDFNVEDEYKPDPLVPQGNYHAVVTKVSLNASQFCIVWDLCLHDNGGVMSDGETPIDGAHIYFRNWLPKPGDENELTKSGRNNKRQSKINMLKDFMETMSLNMTSPQIIAQSLNEAIWVGLEADLDIGTDEYMGRVKNVVNRMKPSTI